MLRAQLRSEFVALHPQLNDIPAPALSSGDMLIKIPQYYATKFLQFG